MAVGSKINCGGEWVAMTCRDFERAWNELLDAEAGGERAGAGRAGASAARPGRGRARACLAGPCGRVRRLRPGGARYQALRRAIRAWGPPPAPSAGLADRILAEIQTPAPSAWPVYGSVRREPLGRRCRRRSRRSPPSAAAIAHRSSAAESIHRPNATERPTGRAA